MEESSLIKGLCSDQLVFQGMAGQVRIGLHVHFFHDPRPVCTYGRRTERELGHDKYQDQGGIISWKGDDRIFPRGRLFPKGGIAYIR
jgi:hypothetical protein